MKQYLSFIPHYATTGHKAFSSLDIEKERVKYKKSILTQIPGCYAIVQMFKQFDAQEQPHCYYGEHHNSFRNERNILFL